MRSKWGIIMSKKGVVLYFFIFLLAFTVAGCSGSDDLDSIIRRNDLTIVLELDSELLAEVNADTIEDHITLKSAQIKLYHNNDLVRRSEITKENFEEQIQVSFQDLEVENSYKIEVEVFGTVQGEDEARLLYEDSRMTPPISSDETTIVTLPLSLFAPRSLKVNEVIIDDSLDIETIEKIRLEQSDSNSFEKPYDSDGVIFVHEEDGVELTPALWEVKVILADGSEYGRSVLLLPDAEKEISLEIKEEEESGEIEIDIIMHSSPDEPDNLRVDSKGDLIWDGSADFYKVYKSSSAQLDEAELSIATVEENKYSNPKSGYYYWVRAYKQRYSSALSEAFYYELSEIEVSVIKALSGQDIISRQEHLSIDATLLERLGIEVGQQVRIILADNEDKYAIYTVAEARDEGGNTVRMGLSGRERLEQEDPFDAYLSLEVVSSSLSTKEEASENNEFVESLRDESSNNDVVAIAPHAGFIERYTEKQSDYFADTSYLSNYGVSVWNCYGYQSDLGAYDAWHITSNDINELNFPKLNQIIDRNFKFAVAFHGHRADGYEVILGGNTEYMLSTDKSLKDRIEELIIEKSDGNIEVIIAEPGHYLGGFSERNIVNRLASQDLGGEGGIQIEASMDARRDYRDEIASAVAQAISEALD